MYKYDEQKSYVFTDAGQRVFLKIRDHVQRCLKLAGAVSMGGAISTAGNDSWESMACVDRLVELKEVREIPQANCAGQNRIFVKA